MLLLCCIDINFDNGIAYQVYWTCWLLDFKKTLLLLLLLLGLFLVALQKWQIKE